MNKVSQVAGTVIAIFSLNIVPVKENLATKGIARQELTKSMQAAGVVVASVDSSDCAICRT